MKRWSIVLLTLALLAVGCTGCGGQKPSGIFYDITGIAPDETVMEMGGSEVPAELYFYWLAYGCSYYEYNLSGYGAYDPSLFDEEGNLNWDAELSEGESVNQYAREYAENNLKFLLSVENLAAQNGVTLTDEDQTAIDGLVDDAREQLGGEEAFQERLTQMGISQDSFERIYAVEFLVERLAEKTQEEGSELWLEDADYEDFATYADHILLSTVDLTTGAPLSEEEIAAKRSTAEDLLAQLQAAEDVESLFAQLADEYSEDTGRASNPTGYIYTAGTMVSEFEDAAAALQPGQISGIVETSYGYHILLRKDLAQGLAAYPDQKAELAKAYVAMLAEERMDDDITYSDKLADIVPGEFYASYTAALDAMLAADSGEDDGTGGENGEDANGGSNGADNTGTGSGDATDNTGGAE